ncbi:MAG: TonB family protein [Verrucomicrobia bacterium]|nr:TonB family protein [Verrucomicrobiota bacterium]MDA1069660.1 TonB family protein [Verrucomicrobiota bacterium]
MKTVSFLCFVTAFTLVGLLVFKKTSSDKENSPLHSEELVEIDDESRDSFTGVDVRDSINQKEDESRNRVVSAEILDSLDQEKVDTRVLSDTDLNDEFEAAEKAFSNAKNPEDFQRAFQLFNRLAKKGHPESLRITAEMLEKGLGVKEDSLEAYNFYRKAAELGDPVAQYRLAQFLEEGLVEDQDFEEAYHWYEKAADQNLPDAWAQLGRLISEGTLVESDYELALDYFKKAEEMGSEWGTFYKATALLEGWGVEQNLKEAIGIMKSLGNNGFHQAQAALYILYMKAKFVEKDPIQALNWLSMAAEESNSAYQHVFASYLYKGELVPQDIHKAFNLLEESALDGQLEAIYRLSLLSYKEAKSRDERDKAIEFLDLAAEYGHHKSQLLIAYTHAIEADVREDKQAYDRAITVLEKAEDNAKAQYALRQNRIDGVPLKTALKITMDSDYIERQNYNTELGYRETQSRQPQVIHSVTPQYPQGLLVQDFTGKVFVVMIIDEEGNPTTIQIEDSPHPAFTKAAIEAVEQWKFNPALKDGLPTRSKVRLPLSFTIKR